MPPKLVFYLDSKLTQPVIGVIDFGTLIQTWEKEVSIFCRNEGDEALDDIKVEIIPGQLGSLDLLVNVPPLGLGPGEVWEAKFRWRAEAEDEEGTKRASLKITGVTPKMLGQMRRIGTVRRIT